MKKFVNEFKQFALKGNVVDLAVGVIIGAAFGKIVTSLVNDVIMPLLGLATGRVNLADLKIVLMEKSALSSEVALRYGSFIQTIIDFLIISASIFIIVKFFNRVKRIQEEIQSTKTDNKIQGKSEAENKSLDDNKSGIVRSEAKTGANAGAETDVMAEAKTDDNTDTNTEASTETKTIYKTEETIRILSEIRDLLKK